MMTRKREKSSPAVKAANSLKRKYGTGAISPRKTVRAKRAIIEVKDKTSSIRQAARKHSLSVSFLRRRLSGEVPLDSRNGPSPVFNNKEEETMAIWLKEMAERGLGLKPGEFLNFVQGIVRKENRKTPFIDGRPSYKWYRKFMQRNKHIVQIRTETLLEASRAKLTRKSVDGWYCEYRDFLIEHGLLHKPNCIYNADETGFNMSSKAGKVIGPTRCNQNSPVPHVSGGHSKERLTVMFCGCADGSMIPPFLVYPQPTPKAYNPLTGGITGSDIVYTKKGWMDSEAYEDFLKHFDKYASKDRPVCLLIDSVSSHISLNAFKFAKTNGILLYRIVPNATHLMQPLDKGVFGPLKQRWHQIARAHARKHPGVSIGKENFPEKLKEAYLLFYKPLTVLNSFKSSGIYPVDSTVITDENLKPGLTYEHSDDETEERSKAKPTKCSQEELEAQGALRAFEKALCTPTRQKYKKRIEEGYDIIGESPCFDVYKKLKCASEGSQASTSKYDSSISKNTETEDTQHISALDLLASAALQECGQMTSSNKTVSQSDSQSVVSPVLLESVKLPKSTKPKKMAPKRLLNELPYHLTSKESVRKMALRDLSKVRDLAEKEKKAKQKYLISTQEPQATSNFRKSNSKNINKDKRKQRTIGGKRASEVTDNVAVCSTDSVNQELITFDDNEDVECKGCCMTWSEDQELGLGRTWVNCDVCNNWMHSECSSKEVESDEPFCCPDCDK